MIVDSLRRCSDSNFNQKRKPGRNVIMFLIIANFATYFWDTFEIKSAEYQVEMSMIADCGISNFTCSSYWNRKPCCMGNNALLVAFLTGGAEGVLRGDTLDNFEPHHTSSLHLLPVSLCRRTLRHLELGLQARRPPLTYFVSNYFQMLQQIDIYCYRNICSLRELNDL